MKYRFITVFGKESENPFNDIVKLTNKIINASNFLGRRYWKDEGRRKFTDEQFQKHLEKMEEYEVIIWEGYEEDEIKTQLDDIIMEIEKICNAVLKKKITVYNKEL